MKYKEKHGKIVAAKERMEKPSKHAFLLAILIMALVLCSCKGSAKEEPVADYESMQEAVLAHKAGTDITGKTIKVDSVDDHLKYSIYVYAVEYQIYR